MKNRWLTFRSNDKYISFQTFFTTHLIGTFLVQIHRRLCLFPKSKWWTTEQSSASESIEVCVLIVLLAVAECTVLGGAKTVGGAKTPKASISKASISKASVSKASVSESAELRSWVDEAGEDEDEESSSDHDGGDWFVEVFSVVVSGDDWLWRRKVSGK